MSENDKGGCPVDHSTREAWVLKAKSVLPLENKEPEQPACPVDHNARQNWLSKVSITAMTNSPAEAIEVEEGKGCNSSQLEKSQTLAAGQKGELPTERQISSIPRASGDSNWIYPSEMQFFEAMKRKNWNPSKEDMKVVVPIHNAVNERAWQHILNWERANYQETLRKCGGIKLTSFSGDLKKLTPRAWFNSTVLGYEKPFDRHDWIIDRCGTQVEYVIDFYTGNGKGASFFIDARPKLNSWEGVKLRLMRSVGLA